MSAKKTIQNMGVPCHFVEQVYDGLRKVYPQFNNTSEICQTEEDYIGIEITGYHAIFDLAVYNIPAYEVDGTKLGTVSIKCYYCPHTDTLYVKEIDTQSNVFNI